MEKKKGVGCHGPFTKTMRNRGEKKKKKKGRKENVSRTVDGAREKPMLGGEGLIKKKKRGAAAFPLSFFHQEK